jgi:hypothetical protein
MFGSDIMIAPVLEPVGSDSSGRVSSGGRNGGSMRDLPVSSVKVYLPARTVWVHLWTGQEVHAGDEGRFVSVDAPIGYPPVFYVPSSKAGIDLRAFVFSNGFHSIHSVGGIVEAGRISTDTISVGAHHPLTSFIDVVEATDRLYTSGASIGNIADYVAPDWAEWLGISQYVSKWNTSYYSTPSLTAVTDSSDYLIATPLSEPEQASSVSLSAVPLESKIDKSEVGESLISVFYPNLYSPISQDIDVDLSSLFYSFS